MMIDREQKYREMATRGKYRRLYAHLCCGLRSQELCNVISSKMGNRS